MPVCADTLGAFPHARQAQPAAFLYALERKAHAVVRDLQVYGILVESQADSHLSGRRVFERVVERWVLHPSAAILAEDVSRDELGGLPLAPDRNGKPLMLDLRDLERSETARHWFAQHAAEASDEQEEWDEEEPELGDWDEEELDLGDLDNLSSFEDVLENVRNIHADQSPAWWEYE